MCAGIDAAKVTHGAAAVDPASIDRRGPERQHFRHEAIIGRDVVASSAPCIVAVLPAEGVTLVPGPSIAMNRAGHGCPGRERKAGPLRACTIAEPVRRGDLRPIMRNDDTFMGPGLVIRHGRVVIRDRTCLVARRRGLARSIHSGLEKPHELTCKRPLPLLPRHFTTALIRRVEKFCRSAHIGNTPHLNGTNGRLAQARDVVRTA